MATTLEYSEKVHLPSNTTHVDPLFGPWYLSIAIEI